MSGVADAGARPPIAEAQTEPPDSLADLITETAAEPSPADSPGPPANLAEADQIRPAATGSRRIDRYEPGRRGPWAGLRRPAPRKLTGAGCRGAAGYGFMAGHDRATSRAAAERRRRITVRPRTRLPPSPPSAPPAALGQRAARLVRARAAGQAAEHGKAKSGTRPRPARLGTRPRRQPPRAARTREARRAEGPHPRRRRQVTLGLTRLGWPPGHPGQSPARPPEAGTGPPATAPPHREEPESPPPAPASRTITAGHCGPEPAGCAAAACGRRYSDRCC